VTRSARALTLAAIVAAACLLVLRAQRGTPPGEPPAISPPPPSAPPARPPSAPPRAEGAEIAPEETTLEDDNTFRLLVFPVLLAGARFRVIDLGMTRDLERVMRETGASLVVNGGFFDPTQRPEGLVISEGQILSPRSDTLGGGIVVVAGGRATLAPAEGLAPPGGADFAIQARPRLVVDGGSAIKHDDGRAAERTALCLREQGRELEVVVARGEAAGKGPTLALLADMLASRGCEGALNLDGGPSTGVAWRQKGEVKVLPPRGPLRHAVAVWAGAGG